MMEIEESEVLDAMPCKVLDAPPSEEELDDISNGEWLSLAEKLTRQYVQMFLGG